MAYRHPRAIYHKQSTPTRYDKAYNPFIHNESANRKFEATLAECSKIKNDQLYPLLDGGKTQKTESIKKNVCVSNFFQITIKYPKYTNSERKQLDVTTSQTIKRYISC